METRTIKLSKNTCSAITLALTARRDQCQLEAENVHTAFSGPDLEEHLSYWSAHEKAADEAMAEWRAALQVANAPAL